MGNNWRGWWCTTGVTFAIWQPTFFTKGDQPGNQHQLCSLQWLCSLRWMLCLLHMFGNLTRYYIYRCLVQYFCQGLQSPRRHIPNLPKQISWNSRETGEDDRDSLRWQRLYRAWSSNCTHQLGGQLCWKPTDKGPPREREREWGQLQLCQSRAEGRGHTISWDTRRQTDLASIPRGGFLKTGKGKNSAILSRDLAAPTVVWSPVAIAEKSASHKTKYIVQTVRWGGGFRPPLPQAHGAVLKDPSWLAAGRTTDCLKSNGCPHGLAPRSGPRSGKNTWSRGSNSQQHHPLLAKRPGVRDCPTSWNCTDCSDRIWLASRHPLFTWNSGQRCCGPSLNSLHYLPANHGAGSKQTAPDPSSVAGDN